MSDLDPGGLRRSFRYHARAPGRAEVSEVIQADDERAALRELTASGLVVISLSEIAPRTASASTRELKLGERILLLQQLALMLEAGVPLLEAVQTIASEMPVARGRAQLEAVIEALRSGIPLGQALQDAMPGFPTYAYALIHLGEASGRTAEVLKAATDQMAYEDRLGRHLLNALTYPAFLAVSGFVATAFIFIEIVPRFDAMLEQSRARLPAMSRVVLGIGTFVDGHGPLVILGTLAAIALIGMAGTSAAVRREAFAAAHRLPGLGQALTAREVALWGRLTGFALQHGVGLLDALALSRAGTPPGPFKTQLQAVETDLRAGVGLHTSLARRTGLSAMDISLLRTGERSGALPKMLAVLAEGYDSRLRDLVKRFTALAEPIAIGVISIFVGVIVLSLVMALASLYDAVG